MAKKTSVTVKQMEIIADRMAAGESLLQITKHYKRDGLPSYRSITRAVHKDDRLWEIYHRGRVLQAEFYLDLISELATQKLDKDGDPRFMNAEVQRRRLEIDSLKWCLARIQPYGIRDKKEEAAGGNSITVSWDGPVQLATSNGRLVDESV